MKHVLTTGILLLVVTATLAAQEHVALVTSVTGQTLVTLGGKEEPAVIGRELPKSSVLRVVDGSAAVVFLSGDFVELTSGDLMELGADAASSVLKAGGGTRGADDGAVKVADRGVTAPTGGNTLMNLAYVPGVRGDVTVAALSPRQVISSDRPVFYWFDSDSSHAGTTRQWVLVVRDDEGKTLVQKSVEGEVYAVNQASLPELFTKASPTPGRRYFWGMFPANAAPTSTTPLEASFLIADQEGLTLASAKRKQMDGLRDAKSLDEASWHTLMALYYMDERERLFSDAIPHLFPLMKDPKGKDFARRNLAFILGKFGNQVAAVLPAIVR